MVDCPPHSYEIAIPAVEPRLPMREEEHAVVGLGLVPPLRVHVPIFVIECWLGLIFFIDILYQDDAYVGN